MKSSVSNSRLQHSLCSLLAVATSDAMHFDNQETLPLSPLDLGSPLDDYFSLDSGVSTSVLHPPPKSPTAFGNPTNIDLAISDPLVSNADCTQSWWTDPLLFASTNSIFNPVLDGIAAASSGTRSPSLFSRDPASPSVSSADYEYAKLSSPESTAIGSIQQPRRSSRTSAKHSGGARNRANKRIPHSEVEKKYRESLNANLERLRKVLPSSLGSGRDECDEDMGDDVEAIPKLSKSAVLVAAVDYIRQLEKRQASMTEENTRLRREALRYRRALDILQRRILLAARVRTKDCTGYPKPI